MTRAIVILYSGSEISEYGIGKIGEIIKDFRENGDISVFKLEDSDIAKKVVKTVTIKERTVDTSVADESMKLIYERFSPLFTDTVALTVNLARVVLRDNDEMIRGAVKVLSLPDVYKHSEKLAKQLHFTKSIFDCINEVNKCIK